MINLIGTALRERHGNIAVAQVEFLQRILRQKDRNRNRSLKTTHDNHRCLCSRPGHDKTL